MLKRDAIFSHPIVVIDEKQKLKVNYNFINYEYLALN